MPIDGEGILKQIRADRERLRTLGISEDREQVYYSNLSIDCCDLAKDEEAFKTVIAGLDLSNGERLFVKRVLDAGDGR